MFFLTPRYIKEAKHYRHALRRLINYKRDILAAKDLEFLSAIDERITKAIRGRDREGVKSTCAEIEKAVGKISPPQSNAGLRENVEVFLVAIVIAAGVRAYFLQPFKIPTGSMQPTLFGVVGFPDTKPSPNPIQRAFEFAWLGRSYIDLTAKSDVVVRGASGRSYNGADLREVTYANFFTFTDIVCERVKDGGVETYRVFAPKDVVARDFGVRPGREYRMGEPIVKGHVDTGDQVFVDKMSYNFMNPALGDVFVFKTNGIELIQRSLPPGIESQHYIKRLAGLPGDKIQIDPPRLFINGKVPDLWVFQRVMSAKDGYRGYSNASLNGTFPGTNDLAFDIPLKNYFALGDNSYNSSDSRYWGTVPEKNVTGRGLFVYWPFSKRWGFIR